MSRYPPMPWRLLARGVTVATLHAVPIARVRPLVPPELPIVPILPGRTGGGLFLAEYGPGSALEYNELIVAPALVWHEGRPRPWVTHLWVDSAASVEGGREALGVPKRFAPFAREVDPVHGGERIVVGTPAAPICTLRRGRPRWLWRQGVRVVSLHRDVREGSGERVVVQGNTLRGRGGIVRAGVEIPREGPLHVLGLGRPLLSLCAREVEAVLGGADFHPARTVRLGGRDR